MAKDFYTHLKRYWIETATVALGLVQISTEFFRWEGWVSLDRIGLWLLIFLWIAVSVSRDMTRKIWKEAALEWRKTAYRLHGLINLSVQKEKRELS